MARRPGAAWTAPMRLTDRPIAPAGSRLRTRFGRSAVVSRTSRRRRSAAVNCCSRRCAIVLGGERAPWHADDAQGAALAERLDRRLAQAAPGGLGAPSPDLPNRTPLAEIEAGVAVDVAIDPDGVFEPSLRREPIVFWRPSNSPDGTPRDRSRATSRRRSPTPTFAGSTPAWLLWRRPIQRRSRARGAAAGLATSLGVLTGTRSGSPAAMGRRRGAQRRSRAMSRSRATAPTGGVISSLTSMDGHQLSRLIVAGGRPPAGSRAPMRSSSRCGKPVLAWPPASPAASA